jgi:hypothetical protein
VKRPHEPQRVIGDFVAAEIAEKQARSIKNRIMLATPPLAKDVEEFRFDGTPIHETLVRDLASGNFLAQRPATGGCADPSPSPIRHRPGSLARNGTRPGNRMNLWQHSFRQWRMYSGRMQRSRRDRRCRRTPQPADRFTGRRPPVRLR